MPIVIAAHVGRHRRAAVSLERMARSTSLSHRKGPKGKALLLAADGVATNEVARRCGTTDESVRLWRQSGG